ncbi:hypothetical protein DSECCO2_600310 [anaerobic digester metagenome]
MVILQDRSESEYLQAFLLQVIRQPIILIVPHRSQILQGAVRISVRKFQSGQRDFFSFGEVEVITG